tara:strand:- start:16611 stop:17840 length:1230 start_codon:yes stop_codon:yes gene_type:complete
VRILSFILLIAAALPSSTLRADDWPTYRHDSRRSGVSAATLKFPLSESWQVKGGYPRQAWSGPAKWDAYSGNSGLQSMRNFDPCFYVTSVGNLVYFGSSHDNAVHALDAETGEERWVFFTEAPVRLPPTIHDGVAFAGSDDGHLYALDARSGNLLWKDRGAPDDRRIPSNASMISLWPVRTAPLVVNNTLFFTASLTPWESSWLIAANPETGIRQFSQEISNVTLQGALLATADTLIAPQGRSAPLLYDLKTGKPSGAIGHAGGVFCLVTEDNQLISGPKSQKAKDNQLFLTDAKGARVATFNDTSCAVVANGIAYLHTRGSLKAVALGKIKDELSEWAVDTPPPSELIVSSGAVILGYDGGIKAYSRENGSLLWESLIPQGGAVHGLAISGSMLYASDSHGTIRAYAP